MQSREDGFLDGEALMKRGARAVLVKLGSEGCAFSAADRARVHVRPAPKSAIDTTGAGDAFTGALAVALLERRTPEEAVCFAVAAAAIAVTRYGSQPSYPDRQELEREVKQVHAVTAKMGAPSGLTPRFPA